MKKIFLPLLVFCLIITTAVLIQPLLARSNPSSVQVYTNDAGGTNGVSTTTAVFYLKTAATSTIAFDPQNGDLIQISASALTTTTVPTIQFSFDFSNNNIDWYPFTVATSTWEEGNRINVLSAAGKPTIWSWSAATTTAMASTTYMTTPFTLNQYAAKYGRLNFKVLSADVNLHVELAQKKQF